MISVSTESRLAPSVRPKTIGYAVQRLVTRKRQFPDKMSELARGSCPRGGRKDPSSYSASRRQLWHAISRLLSSGEEDTPLPPPVTMTKIMPRYPIQLIA